MKRATCFTFGQGTARPPSAGVRGVAVSMAPRIWSALIASMAASTWTRCDALAFAKAAGRFSAAFWAGEAGPFGDAALSDA